MKILFLSQYYKPDIVAGTHLVVSLIEDMCKSGIDVTLITQMPSRGVDQEDINFYKTKKIEKMHNLTIHRVEVKHKKQSFINRALHDIGSNCRIFLKALFVTTDVIFTYSTPPTMGLIAVILGKIKRVPVVYNLQDIFPDSIINSGVNHSKLLIFCGKIIEKISYRWSTRIVVISKDFKKIIMNRGVPESKIDLIYNWIDENEVFDIPRNENKLFDKYHLDRDKFYITYCGNIGHTQNLELLLEVADELKSNIDINFVIIGDGNHKSFIKKIIDEKNLNNVYLLPFQPYKDIAHVYSLGDIGIIISKKNIGKNSFPSKTWSIMSASRPVIASFDLDSELCSIIQEAKSGICVQVDDKILLKSAMMELFDNKDNAKNNGLNGRICVLENFKREVGTSKYTEIINSFSKPKIIN